MDTFRTESPVETAEFEQLMVSVAAGSEEAVWQLAERFTPYIVRAVRQSLSPRLRSKLDSQDFVQSLWASILLKRADLSRLETPEQFVDYLTRATKNRVIDKIRHFQAQKYNINREERLHDILAIGESDRAFYSRDATPSATASTHDRFRRILLNASEQDRQILKLRLEGCTFDGISGKLKISQATARRAIGRLIENFRNES